MAEFINNSLHTLPGSYMQSCVSGNEGFITCMAQYLFDVTNGIYWAAMLLGFGIAMFVATLKIGPRKAFGFVSFIWIQGAMMLAVMELVTWWIASAFIITGLIGLGMMFVRE